MRPRLLLLLTWREEGGFWLVVEAVHTAGDVTITYRATDFTVKRK